MSGELSAYVRDWLAERNMSLRKASGRAGLPVSTLDAVINRRGSLPNAETRAGLVRLGMDYDTVEFLAARQAGLDIKCNKCADG